MSDEHFGGDVPPSPAPDAEPTLPSLREPKLRLITQKTPWPRLVERLKELTAQAERGEVAAFGFVLEDTNGRMAYRVFHGEGSNVLKMIAELEIIKLACIQRHAEKLGDELDDDD